MSRKFPIMLPLNRRRLCQEFADSGCPEFWPWDILTEQHERRAMANHDQTLKRLAERGGLDPYEMLSLLTDKSWSYYDPKTISPAEVTRRLLEFMP